MEVNLKVLFRESFWQFALFLVAVYVALTGIIGIVLALLHYEVFSPIVSEAPATGFSVTSVGALILLGILFIPAVIIAWFLTCVTLRNKRMKKQLVLDQQLLEMVNDLIFVHDLGGGCIFATKMDRKNGGSTGDELMDINPQTLNHLVYNELIKPKMNVLTESDGVTFESTHIQQNGNSIPVEVFSRIARSENHNSVLTVVRNITERIRTEEQLRQSSEKLMRAIDGTINSMALISEVRDPYTAGHQQRVAKLATAIARELGLSEEQIEGIRVAGILHDIGKICVPVEILSKPGRLRKSEFNLVKDHAEVGYGLLKTIEFAWPVAEIVLQHHERMDGSGYPNGLSGEDISIEARIMGVADVIESMSSHRPYRPAFNVEKALLEIILNKGVLYDGEVVDACVELFNDKGFEFSKFPDIMLEKVA